MNLYEYAVIRLVPDIERGECLNVGVVLYCQKLDFLDVRFGLDEIRVKTFAPAADLAGVRLALGGIASHCAGDDHAGGDSLGRRFRWLTAPRSTIVQAGPVHPGLADDPAATLDRLFARLVG